jgi:spore germination cell wall hydrolase CwlJ-like protein
MIATEARGEGRLGMEAVAHVAMNRLKTGYWGQKSLQEVIYYPQQFSGIHNAVKPEDYKTARAVALAVLNGQAPDPTKGARHHHSGPPPPWVEGRKPAVTLGGHFFYNDIR